MVFLFMIGSLGLAALESYRSSSFEKKIMSGESSEVSAEKEPAESSEK